MGLWWLILILSTGSDLMLDQGKLCPGKCLALAIESLAFFACVISSALFMSSDQNANEEDASALTVLHGALLFGTILAMPAKQRCQACPDDETNLIAPLIILAIYHFGMTVWGAFFGLDINTQDDESTSKMRNCIQTFIMPILSVVVFVIVAGLSLSTTTAASMHEFDFLWIVVDALAIIFFYPMLLMANALSRKDDDKDELIEEPEPAKQVLAL